MRYLVEDMFDNMISLNAASFSSSFLLKYLCPSTHSLLVYRLVHDE